MCKNKIKVLFVLNHLQFSDGVAATLLSLVRNINMDDFDIHILPLYKHDSAFTEPIKEIATIHRGIGCYFKGLSTLLSFFPLKWLYRFWIKGNYDMEIAYQFGMSTKILSVSPNQKKICWMHGFDNGMILKKYYKKFLKVISVSKIGSKKLKTEGLNSDYCYNIIDECNIYNKSKEPAVISKSKQYLLITICRLSPEKALLREIECIKNANIGHKRFELWIIGDGPEKEKIQKYIDSNNIGDSIKMLGQQDNPHKYLTKADLYLCGSLNEGFNTACQEAAILGIPVVSTDVDGAEELIKITEAGRVVPNSKDGIQSVFNEIIENPSLLDTWKMNAENNKIKLYKDARIKKIENILKNLK